jgi:hypothetical protein
MLLHEHRYNLKVGLLEKSKLGWDEVRILEIENNSRYRKSMELAHMAYLMNPISQPSWGISPIWIPISSNDVSNSQR